MLASLIGIVCSVYVAWHWGGTERDALQFGLLLCLGLCLVLFARTTPGRCAVACAGAVTGWTVLSVLSARLSASPSLALPSIPLLLWYAVLALAGGAAVGGGAGTNLARGLVAGGVLQAAVGLYDRWGAGSASAQASGTFYAINQFAGFLALLLPLAVAFALTTRRTISIWFASAVLMGTAILLSGSRGGLGASGLGCIIVLASSVSNWRRRLARGALIGATVVVLSWLLSSPLVVADSGTATSAIASRAGTEGEHAAERVNWWIGAVRIWADHPWTGSGPGTYGFALFSHQESTWAWSRWAHNAYAQTLAETGLIGAGLLAAAVAAGILPALRRLRGSSATALSVGLAGGLVAAASHLFMDVDLEYPAYGAVLFLALGAAAGLAGRPISRRALGGLVIPALALCVVLVAGEVVVEDAVQSASEMRLQRAAWLHPGDAIPWSALTDLRARSGDLEGSLAAVNGWLARDGLDPTPWIVKGSLLEQAGRPDEAIEAYKRAVERHPASPSMRHRLAEALEGIGRTREAYATIEAGLAIRLRPEDRKYPQLAALASYGAELASRQGDEDREARYRATAARLRANPG